MYNRVLDACGLETRPRWIELESIGYQRCRKMCSSCGETINKRKKPDYCPNCKAYMKSDNEKSFNI